MFAAKKAQKAKEKKEKAEKAKAAKAKKAAKAAKNKAKNAKGKGKKLSVFKNLRKSEWDSNIIVPRLQNNSCWILRKPEGC